MTANNTMESPSTKPLDGMGFGAPSCSAYMPVMGYFDYKTHRYIPETKIPWRMIEAHDDQAKLNHCNQGLERLRQRGGVSACEALAILDDREWEMMDDTKAYDEVVRRVNIFLQNGQDHRSLREAVKPTKENHGK